MLNELRRHILQDTFVLHSSSAPMFILYGTGNARPRINTVKFPQSGLMYTHPSTTDSVLSKMFLIKTLTNNDVITVLVPSTDLSFELNQTCVMSGYQEFNLLRTKTGDYRIVGEHDTMDITLDAINNLLFELTPKITETELLQFKQDCTKALIEWTAAIGGFTTWDQVVRLIQVGQVATNQFEQSAENIFFSSIFKALPLWKRYLTRFTKQSISHPILTNPVIAILPKKILSYSEIHLAAIAKKALVEQDWTVDNINAFFYYRPPQQPTIPKVDF
jgi:hypothetical protein